MHAVKSATKADPLERPIWHALSACHAAWARAQRRALGYDPAAAPFVATVDDSPESLADLHGLMLSLGRGALFTTEELTFPDTLACVHRGRIEQMILRSPPAESASQPPGGEIRDLGQDDAEAVKDLVDLTKPGPFGSRTLELGRYVGAFDRGALVAMAGERFRLPGHVEISAVCTHPDYRGRGLAPVLVTTLARDAFVRGLMPFLHVFAHNTAAIAVYRKLGFVLSRALHLAVVEPAQT